jgi:hypothetical protein
VTFAEKMLRPWITIGGVVIIIVLAGYVMKSCQHPSGPGAKIPVATQRTLDSLDITRPAFTRATDSIITLVIHDTVQSTQFQAAARRAAQSASVAQRRADSLASDAATAHDSATAWHSAYAARTEEASQLRVVIANDSAALAREISARQHLATLYGADTLRRIAIEKVNSDLRSAIARLEQPCRLIGPIRCPSRITVAVLAGVGGAVAGHAVP